MQDQTENNSEKISLPCRKLFCSVIQQAFQDIEFSVSFSNRFKLTERIIKGRIRCVINANRIASSAHYWLTTEDHSKLFSFVNLCKYLDMDFDLFKNEADRKYAKNKRKFEKKIEQLENSLERIKRRERADG